MPLKVFVTGVGFTLEFPRYQEGVVALAKRSLGERGFDQVSIKKGSLDVT